MVEVSVVRLMNVQAVAANAVRHLDVLVKAAKERANVGLHTIVPVAAANAGLLMNVPVKAVKERANVGLHTIALAVAANVDLHLIVQVKAARAKANAALHTTVEVEAANAVHLLIVLAVAANAVHHLIVQENSHAYNIVTPNSSSKICTERQNRLYQPGHPVVACDEQERRVFNLPM